MIHLVEIKVYPIAVDEYASSEKVTGNVTDVDVILSWPLWRRVEPIKIQ